MSPLPTELTVALALLVGGGIGYYVRYLYALSKKRSIEHTVKEIELKAEEKAIAVVEKAEAKAEALVAEAKAERKERELELKHKDERLEKREELLDTRQIDLDSQTENVRNKIDEVKMLKQKLDERAHTLEQRLHEVAGLTPETAYEHIVRRVSQTREQDIVSRIQKLELLGEEQFTERARNLLLTAIHRVGNSLPTNIMTAAVEIPSDDIKGKIIGKEGRNVRAFERITGVEVLVDDTPGYIVLSSFDPIRREIARVALEALIKDGRIQPAKIEETVEKARQDVAKTIKKMGEQATFETNVHGLHPELITILGRLYFRSSYGQNVLAHSVEMAHLAGMIAAEVGADPAIARAGALVHDIGKVASHDIEGTHVEIGIRLLKKYDVDERIILAMRAHHEEYPYETPESIIVQVADAISGARPGARRDSVENYIKRLTELEAIAQNLQGVEKAFAIAAGREIRVMVNPESLNEIETRELARTIASNIQNQLRYPGEIKVHVIRETRVISYAR
ncbi:ribonuclease Y [bacterium]|nr:ribonuclease Y [bacterium]|tara:strand:+ start:36 stop:1565 length:1530 start_codon:yes stop_codon:yes gene_type:complete